ncbi:MAG: hypothetical protein D8M58_19980 [Calditrichaeota bacterium]|nr:MAG: hypothetical protein DWQ03_14725 [Calditrichota bacterium]MBL1207689.1 hypothetical protein [Calditrichota bacterium]NOG47523.1 4Fe-4S binding protein [Calditrichota bacterium]
MFFNKKSKKQATLPFPGTAQLIEGKSSLDKILADSNTKSFNNDDFSAAVGYAMAGNRAAAFIDEFNLNSFTSYLDKPFSLVIYCNQNNLSQNSHLNSLDNSFVLFPKNVQELLDYSLIARKISELALVPGVIVYDSINFTTALQTVIAPDLKLISSFLGNVDDIIDTPSESQKILFGKNRLRTQAMVDVNKPLGIGVNHDRDVNLKLSAVKDSYFKNHLSKIIKFVFTEFKELTGRVYSGINYYEVDDSQYVIAANGPMVNKLVEYADWYRKKHSVKLGIIDLSLAGPFNGSQLSHYIKKKKGLTVLCDIKQPVFENSLTASIKNMLNKAWENGRNKNDNLPHKGYAVFNSPKDQPLIFEGFYDSTLNEIDEIHAIVENMMQNENGSKLFFTGFDASIDQSRFPKLETLQQILKKSYPEIEQLALPVKNISTDAQAGTSRKACIFASVSQDIIDVGTPLAKAFEKSELYNIQTSLNEQKSALMPLHEFTMLYTSLENEPPFSLKNPDIMLMSELQFKNNLSTLAENGALVINTHFSDEKLWLELGEKHRRIIREKNLSLFTLNTAEIAKEIDIIPGSMEHLKLCALIGALYKVDPLLGNLKFGVHLNNFKKVLKSGELFDSQISEKVNAIKRGYNFTSQIEWQQLPELSGLKAPETEAPWTVKQVTKSDGSIFDLARSWDSVGYLFNNNQQNHALADPFLASNTLPARSSAFRDMSEMKEKIPEIIPEKCTGCGMCWSQCPDSALPVHVMNTTDIISTVLTNAASNGTKLIQMQRMADNLAKQAYKLFSTDEMRNFLTTKDLLSEAFNHLSKKMGLKGEALEKVEAEFELFLAELNAMPLIKTHSFFDQAHNDQKGSGQLLSIVVNANACKGCGSCANVCPDNAIEMLDNNADILALYRKNFSFMQTMPDVTTEKIEKFISAENQKSILNKLINKRAYFTLPGGDNAYPGSGVKAAVHLMTATIESTMNARFELFINKLDQLISQLESKIQGDLISTVQINEFEDFGQRLSELNENDITEETLIGLTKSDQTNNKIDARQIKKLTGFVQKLTAIKNEYSSASNGNGSARMSMVVNSERLLEWSAVYPYNPFSHPWLNASGNNLATTVEGLFEGITEKLQQSFKLIRIAELELNDKYSPRDHDAFFKSFSWNDFSIEERELCPPAILLLDQQALEQQSFKSISSLLNSEKPLYISVINNMVGSTSEIGHEIALWALSQHNSFVLQSTPANPGHLMDGITQLMSSNKPGFMHLYACEPYVQGIEKDQAYTHEQRAINSRVFPLFKYNPYSSDYFIERFDLSGNPDLELDWQSEDKNRSKQSITIAEWAIHEKFYKDEFHTLAKRSWNEKMVPLEEYLEIDSSEAKTFIPYINITDSKNALHRIQVSNKIAKMARKHLNTWNLLQELAGIRVHDREYQQQKFDQKLEAELSRQKTNLEAEYNAQIMQVQQDHWQTYHGRLRDKLTAIYNSNKGEDTVSKTLAEYAKSEKREA